MTDETPIPGEEPSSKSPPHCLRDNAAEITPRERVSPLHKALVEPTEPTFHEVTDATPRQPKKGATAWMGPVADTVLADFLFYGLLAGIPILFLWLLYGHWWLFRNAEWIAIGVLFWFIGVVAWRRYWSE